MEFNNIDNMNVNQLIDYIYGHRSYYKGLSILYDLLNNNDDFNQKFRRFLKLNFILPFDEEVYDKISSQNIRVIDNFLTVFENGLNLGCCTPTAKQLSYSYDNVDLVSGINKYLIGTINSPNGEHSWLEIGDIIYDTTLMVKINKSIAHELGYIEEVRITYRELNCDSVYISSKEFTNDINLKK